MKCKLVYARPVKLYCSRQQMAQCSMQSALLLLLLLVTVTASSSLYLL